MLSQNFYRKDAGTPRRSIFYRDRNDKRERARHLEACIPNPSASSSLSLLILSLCLCVSAVNFSCSSKPTNLRALAPADTLVYLETNDLGAALQPIVDNKAFEQVAKSKPDLSALRGVQLAVAVMGFETKEEKVTDENSVGRIQPHFAAIADTHAWNWQARKFAEDRLGEFINNIYGGGVNLDTSAKNGGTYYVWTAEDGRKAYAFVDGSLIFFGNDESSIDKCLAVKRGEADSILKNPKLPAADPNALAQGYISTDGVAQIANIVGLRFANEAGKDSEVQSAIAGILPNLLRKSVTDITWIAVKTADGIEDNYTITMPTDIAGIFAETMAPGDHAGISQLRWVPADAPTATFYNFKNVQVAWRSVLLVVQNQTDPATGKIITALSDILFEPYGIGNSELFFSTASSQFVTANLSSDGEKPVVVATVIDVVKAQAFLSQNLRSASVVKNSSGLRRSADGESAEFFDDDFFVGGDAEAVDQISKNRPTGPESGLGGALKHTFEARSVVTTVGTTDELAGQIAQELSTKRSDDAKAASTFFTETRFTKIGIERKTTSDFGLIGSIIAQLAPED